MKHDRKHDYPPGGGHCRHGCGAWQQGNRIGAPRGVDPRGECPKAGRHGPTRPHEVPFVTRAAEAQSRRRMDRRRSKPSMRNRNRPRKG